MLRSNSIIGSFLAAAAAIPTASSRTFNIILQWFRTTASATAVNQRRNIWSLTRFFFPRRNRERPNWQIEFNINENTHCFNTFFFFRKKNDNWCFSERRASTPRLDAFPTFNRMNIHDGVPPTHITADNAAGAFTRRCPPCFGSKFNRKLLLHKTRSRQSGGGGKKNKNETRQKNVHVRTQVYEVGRSPPCIARSYPGWQSVSWDAPVCQVTEDTVSHNRVLPRVWQVCAIRATIKKGGHAAMF